MLYEPLDAILGTRSKLRLLRALVPLERPVSGREAARLAGISHYGINALDELVTLAIVRRREASGQHLYTFNRDHVLAPSITGLFEAEDRHSARIVEELADVIEATGRALAAVIFGSSARGEAGPGSDLDVLVLVEDLDAEEAVHSALVEIAPALETGLGVRLSPVTVTISQACRQLRDGDPFMTRVLEEGRRVWGPPLADVVHG